MLIFMLFALDLYVVPVRFLHGMMVVMALFTANLLVVTVSLLHSVEFFTALMFTTFSLATLGFTALGFMMVFTMLLVPHGLAVLLTTFGFTMLLTALLVTHCLAMFLACAPVLSLALHRLIAIDPAAVVDHYSPDRIRMNVFVTIDPGPMPRRVVDDHDALVPRNAVVAPAPWTIRDAQGHAETEADGRTDEEARPRTLIDDDRIVRRHHDVFRTRRHDGDIRTIAHHDLRSAAQVAVVAGALAHALYGVHDFGLVTQEGVAQIVGPVHVGRHGVEHVREGKQRLHRGVPGKLVVVDLVCEAVASD